MAGSCTLHPGVPTWSTCAERDPVPSTSGKISSFRAFLKKPSVHLGASLLVAVFFLYLAFRGTDLRKIAESLREADYRWLGVSSLVMIGGHLVRAWRWRYLLEPIKRKITLRNLFSGVMIGYFMNNLLPRAGELARPYTIGKLEKIPASAALGTVVVERIMDTMAFVLLVFGIPLVSTGPLLEAFPWLREAAVLVLLVTLPILALPLFLMIRRDWTDVILRFSSRVLPERAGKRVGRMVHSFLDGFLFVKRPAVALEIFMMTGVIWGFYLASMELSFYAFHLQGELGWGAAWATLAISSIGIAIPTPGSTGTYHAFTSMTLTRLFGVASSVALGFATATHAVNYIVVTVFGLYFFLKDHMSFSEAVRAVPKEGQ
jgi:uncharacterized protein (TIRG00374 family)